MNLTLYALTASLISQSPMIQLPIINPKLSFYEFNHIQVNHYFKSFFSSYSQTIHASITKSLFTNFLDPPIKVDNKDQMSCISYSNINTTQIYTESILCIDSCTFSDCRNMGRYSKGGAIYFVNHNSILRIHGTIFENCTCLGDGGAIFAASEKGDTNSGGSGSTSHKNMNSFYSHYCCYSECSAEIVEPNNIQFSGYGSALFVASTKIELNYSSSFECPRFSTSKFSYGAQFVMQTEDAKSCYINATTGNSVCCAAIEYRNAKSGFFCYQTIVNQIGGFVTSFTNLFGPVNISCCNLVNNTIKYTNVVPSCSIIHVRMKSVVISQFIVINTKFDGFDIPHHPYFASKEGDKVDEFFITVVDCIIDGRLKNEKYFNHVTTSMINFVDDVDSVSTHKIEQLSLGNCEGAIEPPPLDATSKFSMPHFFSHSSDFSMSETLISKSEVQQFDSKSSEFSSSYVFSSSFHFSSSRDFSPSQVYGLITIQDSTVNEKDSNVPLIGGIVGSIVAVCAISTLTLFIIRKKKASQIEIEVPEVSNVNSSEVIIQNPLYKQNMDDDPFQNDFAEHIASLDAVI